MIEFPKKKKIILVQLFSNGDCLYATAIAKQIKTDYPNSHLTWAIADFCRTIIENNPYVDYIREINDVPKNDLPAFRRLKKKLESEKDTGLWDELFITQNMDENQAYYDGCIRSNIFHAYPHPITVNVKPVLRLTENEKNNIEIFAAENELKNFPFRIIFEFAPQSGQLPITKEFAIELAEKITNNPDVMIILSSGIKINSTNNKIVDGSILTLRETAGLSFYCTHLIGCSSGITWATTSDAAKMLPMIQLVNPDTPWVNPVSRDFKRFNIPTEGIIDLININQKYVKECIELSLINFSKAKGKYNQEISTKFYTSRKIIYNLICQLQFNAIKTHVTINEKIYGKNIDFYRQVILAFLYFPFKLLKNIIQKKILKIK